MTGMSISGKMSVGIRRMVTPPRMMTSIAATTKVYGRRRASRTIHMAVTQLRGRAEALSAPPLVPHDHHLVERRRPGAIPPRPFRAGPTERASWTSLVAHDPAGRDL